VISMAHISKVSFSTSLVASFDSLHSLDMTNTFIFLAQFGSNLFINNLAVNGVLYYSFCYSPYSKTSSLKIHLSQITLSEPGRPVLLFNTFLSRVIVIVTSHNMDPRLDPKIESIYVHLSIRSYGIMHINP
jgi:hypothetical protein